MRVLEADSYPQRARIGARLRGARIGRHLTIKQVAESCGLTEGFISRLERDLTSPSVATLVSLCSVLRIDAGQLLSHAEAAHVTLESAPKLSSLNPGTQELLLTPEKESRLQVIYASLDPASSGSSQNYSINSPVHFVHVIEGSLTVSLQDQHWELKTGDSLTFDGNESHSWVTPEDSGATVMWCLTPATGE